MNQRHTEFFGPDLGRGPFSSQRIETSALQIAAAIAQVRAPLTRVEADLLAHGDFIRQLADRLAPDYAAFLAAEVGNEVSNAIRTSLRTSLSTYSLLDCWLADAPGGGLTAYEPDSVTVNVGTLLETVVSKKRFLLITTQAGVADVTVSFNGIRSWYWGVSRYGRIYYTDRLYFT